MVKLKSVFLFAYRRFRFFGYFAPLSTRNFASISKPKIDSSRSIDFYATNRKINDLIRSGQLIEARSIFDQTESKNTVTWNSMITGYVRRREMAKARHLFDEMPHRDVVSWNLMISGYVSCGGVRFLKEARYLFDEMPKRDIVSWNTMISGYAKNSWIAQALQLFNEMPVRNVVSWNAMVSGFLQNGDVESAVDFFKRMPQRDSASFSVLVSGLIKNGEIDEAARFLLEFDCKDNGREDLVHAYNTLIAGYGQRGNLKEARKLFDKIPVRHDQENERNLKFKRNIVSWNSMIMCYVKAGDVDAARELFDQMEERDNFSWNTIISGYIQVTNMEEASNLFIEMPNPDIATFNIMVNGFAQAGKMDMACEFFERMPQKNLVSWNSMIAAYEKDADFRGAAKIFGQMQTEGQKPDRHTLSSLLTVSTGLVDMHLGMQIHQIVSKTVIPDLPISNSLITMYSRCGAIKEAKKFFDEMRTQKDVISWNAMIGGYASHGFAFEALELFHAMKINRVMPTYITFISVLNACTHAGLVEEGRRQFNSMVSEFGIAPRIEHYASLVDIIGRSGQVEEAMDLIRGMPFEADNAVWGALLGACRVHKNVELARVAAEALMKLEPESSAAYVLLYNMYADMGRWTDATEVRMMMGRNDIKKEKASSWG